MDCLTSQIINSPEVEDAKNQLKAALKESKGSTKNPEVMAAVEKLAALNPIKDVLKSCFMEGEFVAQTSPDFPGRLKPANEDDEDLVQYTLGRLSFGLFQPHNLVCTVRSVRNSLFAIEDPEGWVDGKQSFTYNLNIDLTIQTPCGAQVDAVMSHAAACYEMEDTPNRLGVVFRGGSLSPAFSVQSDPDAMEIWNATFANAYETAAAQRGIMSSVMQKLLTTAFQMTVPTDEEAESAKDHSVSFQMKRSPRGYIDVIYMDEEIRVTRGNRGTVVVVQRLPSSQKVFQYN